MLGCARRLLTKTNLSHARTLVITPEHEALKENLMKLIQKEINPRCAQWEKDEIFPAHEVFKLLGKSKLIISMKNWLP